MSSLRPPAHLLYHLKFATLVLHLIGILFYPRPVPRAPREQRAPVTDSTMANVDVRT